MAGLPGMDVGALESAGFSPRVAPLLRLPPIVGLDGLYVPLTDTGGR